MKYLTLIVWLILATTIVAGYRMETTSYAVESTNTGLAGSDLNTWSYVGRMLWEPFYPASEAYTSLYYLHPGYFETFFIAPEIGISLLYPPAGSSINDANITFIHNGISNGTIYSCNLLVWQNGSLTVNDTTLYPGQGNHSWVGYPLPESDYTWQVGCQNLALETSSSSIGSFNVDRTAPLITINEPLNDIDPYQQFDFDITELHPDYLVIIANGTNYTFNYTDGNNILVAGLPAGRYQWTVVVYDEAGNSVSRGPYDIYVNPDVVSITNVKFNPAIPREGMDTTLSAVINGGFSNVTLSVQINNGPWFNYSVDTYSGSGPYTYFQLIDKSLYEFGDIIHQQWFVLDNLNEMQHSGIYNATVQKPSSGGAFPEPGSAAGAGNLTIIPEPLQVKQLSGILFEVYNNRSIDCELVSARVEDTIGQEGIRDRFKVQSLELGQNYTISPGKTITLQLKPTGWQGIVGTGRVVVESRECGPAEAPLSVEIYFSDVVVGAINTWTQNIIDWVNGVVASI